MKLVPAGGEAEISEVGEMTQFTIEASAKAFAILSDGLYANKIKAVIRELSTNAYDAHVEVGRVDKPFDVHLPTNLDKNFWVRDYGPGMSHDHCMHLWTTFFRSTKNHSNDTAGCLGLGSKSPFAYTDIFTVISHFDGMRRTYNAFKDENGPQFILIDETESNEPTGMKIVVPVNSWNFDEFYYEAYQVYKHFDVKPNFISKNVTFDDYVCTMEGNGWKLYPNEENYILMGQVAYPINNSQLKSFAGVEQFLDRVRGIKIEVPIGAVDIKPDREGLSYVDQTKINIADAINNLSEELSKTIEDRIANEPTLFAARKAYLELDNFMLSHAGNVEWKGQPLFDNLGSMMVHVDPKAPIDIYKKESYKKKLYKQDDEYILFENAVFVFKDEKGSVHPKIKKYLSDNKPFTTARVYIYTGKNVDDFLKLLGDAKKSDIIMLSDLPKPAYNRNSGGGVPCQEFDVDEENFIESKMSVKYDDAIYLVEARRSMYFGDGDYGNSLNIPTMAVALNKLVELGHEFDGTIYTVKPSMVESKNLKGRPNWTSFRQVITPILQEVVDDYASDFDIVNNEKTFSRLSFAEKAFAETQDVIDLVRDFNEYEKELSAAQKSVSNLGESLLKLIDSMGIVPSSKSTYKAKDFNNEFNVILERYSMINSSTRWEPYRPKENEKLVQYIKEIDELNRLRENQ